MESSIAGIVEPRFLLFGSGMLGYSGSNDGSVVFKL